MTPEPSEAGSTPPESDETLPPFLRESPTEIEDLPLQVSLLTMELATQRQALRRLATLCAALASLFGTTAQAIDPPSLPFLDELGSSDGRRENNDH
jgi:hypothetical protein